MDARAVAVVNSDRREDGVANAPVLLHLAREQSLCREPIRHVLPKFVADGLEQREQGLVLVPLRAAPGCKTAVVGWPVGVEGADDGGSYGWRVLLRASARL